MTLQLSFMPKPLLFVLILLSLGAKRREPPLPVAVATAIHRAKELEPAFIGAHVVRMADGKTLYARNEGHLFVPASDTKLFTTALALKRLGPEYRFTTSVVAQTAPDGNGVLHGDLTFVGRGDPSLSARPYPYVKDWPADAPLRPIEELAEQLVKRGLKAVEGDVAGDDTRYPWRPYPGGWNVSDTIFESGAPVSALVVNDNVVTLTLTAGALEGEAPRLELKPPFEAMKVDSHVRTAAQGPNRIHFDGRPGDPYVRIWGWMERGSSDVETIAVADPALFAAALLRQELLRRGVAVSGTAKARHRFLDTVEDLERGAAQAEVGGTELARRESPPLRELLQVVDKVSENLHAEVMLREVGAVRRNMGTAEAGLAELKDFLNEAGIHEEEYNFVDGSGLSRRTLVSPQAVTKLLQTMYAGHGTGAMDRDAAGGQPRRNAGEALRGAPGGQGDSCQDGEPGACAGAVGVCGIEALRDAGVLADGEQLQHSGPGGDAVS